MPKETCKDPIEDDEVSNLFRAHEQVQHETSLLRRNTNHHGELFFFLTFSLPGNRLIKSSSTPSKKRKRETGAPRVHSHGTHATSNTRKATKNKSVSRSTSQVIDLTFDNSEERRSLKRVKPNSVRRSGPSPECDSKSQIDVVPDTQLECSSQESINDSKSIIVMDSRLEVEDSQINSKSWEPTLRPQTPQQHKRTQSQQRKAKSESEPEFSRECSDHDRTNTPLTKKEKEYDEITRVVDSDLDCGTSSQDSPTPPDKSEKVVEKSQQKRKDKFSIYSFDESSSSFGSLNV